MSFDSDFNAEEIELLRFVLKHVNWNKLPIGAVKHPAWESLLRKCGFDEHMPTRDPHDRDEDRMPTDLPNGDVALHHHFSNQGYNEKEIAVILHQLKGKS